MALEFNEYRQNRREQQRLENARIQRDELQPIAPHYSVDEMEQDFVWIGEGSIVGRISDPQQVLSYPDFAGLTASSFSLIETNSKRVKRILNAELWKNSHKRLTVLTRTFHPGASVICQDPDGKMAVNSWRPIKRHPTANDIGLFLEQLGYLIPAENEREAFLDWLAHLEQKPGELPHYGWLHIAENTGTGRNWLASVLCRLWRGYVAPNIDLPALLDSAFNGQLAGRLLAIVDEVQEAAGENPYRHTNRLKSLVNAEYREINPKFGRQFREHNACRWLVFSNHTNALPLNNTDRRWRVVHHRDAPRSSAEYDALYQALHRPEFINAIGVFLANRDISGFNPGERPPMNDAKVQAINASKSLIQKYAENVLNRWPADIITNESLSKLLSDGMATSITPAMRRAMEELGCISIDRPLKIDGKARRCWMLRNHEKWSQSSSASMTDEARRPRRAQGGDSELDILIDGGYSSQFVFDGEPF